MLVAGLLAVREQLESMGWQAKVIFACVEWAIYSFSTLCYLGVRAIEHRYGRRFFLGTPARHGRSAIARKREAPE